MGKITYVVRQADADGNNLQEATRDSIRFAVQLAQSWWDPNTCDVSACEEDAADQKIRQVWVNGVWTDAGRELYAREAGEREGTLDAENGEPCIPRQRLDALGIEHHTEAFFEAYTAAYARPNRPLRTRLERIQAEYGYSFTPRDLRRAFESDPARLRRVGGTSWTIAGLTLGEFNSREEAETYRDQAGFPAHKHPAIEGVASADAILGLHGFEGDERARAIQASRRGA